MAYRLKEIDLKELSLVDRPANQKAHITILKAEGDLGMTNKTDAEKIADLEKSVAALTAQIQKSDAARDQAIALAKLSDPEKTLMKEMTEEEKEEFLGLPEDERKARAKKSAGEVFKTFDGVEVRKADVGAAAFEVLKRQDERLVELSKAAKAAENAAMFATLEKRATEQFPNLVGTAADKAKLLKAAESAGVEVSKYLESVLKVAEDATKEATIRKGASGDKEPEGESASDKVNKLAAERAAKDKISVAKAYDLVLVENPKLYAELAKNAN